MAAYVCRDWMPRNAYTTPIQENPVYRNSGIIKAVSKDGEKIQVGRIDYESFANEEFQYIISPFWEIIDLLPSDLFQGIPGIDMDLRLEHYYRVNYVPVFMTERTPGPNREDLWELLDSVGLDYYDRLEWLIRTDLRAAVDNLIVERARNQACCTEAADQNAFRQILADSQYGDTIIIEQIQTLGRNAKECTKQLNRLMHYGVHLISKREGVDLDVSNYRYCFPIITAMYQMNEKDRIQAQKQGIRKAKLRGKYRGREKMEIDEKLLRELAAGLRTKKISIEETLRLAGVSRSTFYRRLREMQEGK